MRIRFYVSPYFVIKHYLLRDIKSVLGKYEFKGSLLDVGSGEKPYKSLFENITKYSGIDFRDFSINKDFKGERPDYFFEPDYLDSLSLPFESESFDNAVAFQVIEHHRNPKKLVSELSRVVKPNGYILVTAPFLAGIHEEPNDYQRYTRYGLIELFKTIDCDILEIREQGSLFSTISMLLNEYISSFAAGSRFRYFLSCIIYPPLLVFQYLSVLLDKVFKSRRISMNYLVLVRKNG